MCSASRYRPGLRISFSRATEYMLAMVLRSSSLDSVSRTPSTAALISRALCTVAGNTCECATADDR